MLSKDSQNTDTENDTTSWERERKGMEEEIHDLKILYETIAEHSSAIENELDDKNREVSALIQQLKKYLSPQLYKLIVGKPGNISLDYRREFLTIFFSDIMNFTEISDRTDPEVLSDILNEYLNDMAQIALAHGGTVDKFMGDAIMVFFGAPEHTDDKNHARDCCKMALEMQQKIRHIDHEWMQRGIPQGLKVRMGIHSGYCTVGNFGAENRMDYTIIGGNVNIASRLESLATPQSIFISSITRNLLTNDFIAEFDQMLQVKGIHYPVEVFRLLGHREDVHTVDNPYLVKHKDGFVLNEIEFDHKKTSSGEISRIKEALHNVLSIIDKSH
ncbi:adenylate/guanylate cyclase domain-containing protein [Membranicola marinus]|uniref:Adenylate/guanylate cyclase domain-containing protein n=1 Tax=Membranihabitans marinus TaxID=1227546 RepID=A0A953HVA4_9BACT|nr:adenylate/guanylate cyclase domain-containing protein [Membranihabitans marinus]MBY5957181.1 adenylate/guanylate cyclase domain-containing protein [Membranihabitans marinus]